MDALDRKLLRDLRRLWAQALAIALVLACGVGILLTFFGMYRALDETRETYYERNRFADVFAAVSRAPRTLLPEIAAIEGVWAVDARITSTAVLDIPGRSESAMGHIISLPAAGEPRLNVPLLRSGRLPDPEATAEVAINEPFALANGFVPGDTFWANLEGTKRELTITGTLLSPEFIYTIGPGAMVPDNEGFGILWMPERAAAAAFDMTGAFNDISLKLSATARPPAVIDALDDLLDSYGGQGAYERADQQSNAFINAELDQLASMATILPPIFFAISAFLVNMVISRIIFLERSEIGLLKAIGYSDVEVCVHYLALAGLIALVGVGLGFGFGTWLSRAMAVLYANFFDFPYLIFRVSYETYLIAGVVGMLTAILGAARSALRAARLAPAVAMSPPAPPHFKRSLLDRIMAFLRLSQPSMMVLRSILRWPVRSALTSLGLSLAVAILVASSFFNDSLDVLIDTAFSQANRQDAVLLFTNDLPESTLEEVSRLPGVLQTEGQQFQAAVLRNGHLSKRVPIEGRHSNPDLSRVVAGRDRIIQTPRDGILLSERLARQLDVGPGDMVEVEFLSGRRDTHDIEVAGLVTQYFGLGAFMHVDTLDAMERRAPRVSVANVTLDSGELEALHLAIKDLPKLSGTIYLSDSVRSFQETVSENVNIGNTVYLTVAILITFGVSYNGARIQLSERARELASLRILGFTRAEVSFILMGETMVLALVAQPMGWLLGAGIAYLSVIGFESDLYALPYALTPATFAYASLMVLTAALASVLVVRRRLDTLDLVAVMKTRE